MEHNALMSFISDNITENNRVVISSVANYYYTPEKQIIRFTERDGDFSGCTTTITADGGRVSIERDGDYSMYIVGEKNRRLLSKHNTPVGSYNLGITLKEFSSTLDEDGGTLKFEYFTDADLNAVSEISFVVTIKRKQVIQ